MPHLLILVRHGQTELNAEGRIRGLADPELDAVGIRQAQATAGALRPRGITRVVSSPLHRAVATAQIIAASVGVKHVVDDAFTDRDYGPWTSHVTAEVLQEWGSIDSAPGVEAKEAVLARALHGLNALAGTSEAGPIVVVTHDAVIRSVLAHTQPDLAPLVETGSWAELSRVGGGWAIVSVDNAAR